MLRGIIRNRKVLIGIVFFFGAGGALLLHNWHVRPAEKQAQPVKTYKIGQSGASEVQEPSSGRLPEEAVQSPDLPTSTSELSIESPTTSTVDTSDTDSTEVSGSPKSGGGVVPEQVAREADRFREWQAKNEALAERRWANRDHTDNVKWKGIGLMVEVFMSVPIESRRRMMDDLRDQSRRLGATEAEISELEQHLYTLGLDFETEASTEESEAAFRDVILPKMLDLAPAARKAMEIDEQISQEQKELDKISEDF